MNFGKLLAALHIAHESVVERYGASYDAAYPVSSQQVCDGESGCGCIEQSRCGTLAVCLVVEVSAGRQETEHHCGHALAYRRMLPVKGEQSVLIRTLTVPAYAACGHQFRFVVLSRISERESVQKQYFLACRLHFRNQRRRLGELSSQEEHEFLAVQHVVELLGRKGEKAYALKRFRAFPISSEQLVAVGLFFIMFNLF